MLEKFKKIVIDIALFVGFFIVSLIIISLLVINGIKDYHLANLITYFLVFFLFFLIYRKKFITYINDFKVNYKKYFPKYLWIGIMGILLMNMSSTLIGLLVGNLSVNESTVRSTFAGTNIVILLLNVGIMTPICEETVFRLIFKNIFNNKYVFAIITGILFALMHMLETTSLVEWLYLIPYFIMGYTLSYIYYDSDNLINSIIVHSFNNIVTVLLLLMVGV